MSPSERGRGVYPRVPPESRVWASIDKRGPDDCWPWQASVTHNGYGRIKVNGKTVRAHRYVFFLTHGRWPDNDGLHTCDNPPCCNPAHLWDGTHQQNMADCSAKGRNSSGDDHWTRAKPRSVLRGERHPRAKLSARQAKDIVANRLLCRVSLRELGERYGVSLQTIWKICNGSAWAT